MDHKGIFNLVNLIFFNQDNIFGIVLILNTTLLVTLHLAIDLFKYIYQIVPCLYE